MALFSWLRARAFALRVAAAEARQEAELVEESCHIPVRGV
jgi:hypothetical protein